MDVPRIQYAKTSDGVNIAYWTIGKGTPLIYLAHPVWGIAYSSWELPQLREWYERLARSLTLVRYDARGTGESDRTASDCSLKGATRDLEAVIEALGIRQCALIAAAFSSMPAISYIADNPDRVSHLILWSAITNARDHAETSRSRALESMREMAREEWQLYTETMAASAVGSAITADGRRIYARLLAESVSPEGVEEIRKGMRTWDAEPLLGGVRAKTLLVHRRDSRLMPVEASRRLAGVIPGAQLVILDGDAEHPALGDIEESARVIEDFLGIGAPAVADHGLFRTVLFTDLVGHTEMMSRLGDERGRDVLREHERITREVLKSNGGTEVKTMGDGFMASFGSVTKAVECAVALQRAFAEHEGEPLNVRVGLSAGEPIEEDGDLFGATVILASRIAAKAGGGEILVADTVRGLCSGKGFLFADRGEFVAKGFEEPVRVYEVSWRGD